MEHAAHYFISETGELLPLWRDAFPEALGLRFDETGNLKKPTLLWVRLPQNQAVAPLLTNIRQRFGDLPCIVLSDIPDDDQALASFSAAAKGYCNAHATPAFLRQVADVVHIGGLWIGESLMNRLVEATSRLGRQTPVKSADTWASLLTKREQEVVRIIAKGASNKEIARELGISERTVKLHVGAALEKLGVHDRLQIALIVKGVYQVRFLDLLRAQRQTGTRRR